VESGGDLKINTKYTTQINLFECGDNILIPTSNEFLGRSKNEDIVDIAKAYFQALGRVMAFCLFNEMHLSDHVLPQLYCNYLFRGMEPMDYEYEFADLIQHSMELIGHFRKDEDINKVVSFILCSSDHEFEATMTPQEHTRAIIQGVFITGRSIALDALMEGISLGGK